MTITIDDYNKRSKTTNLRFADPSFEIRQYIYEFSLKKESKVTKVHTRRPVITAGLLLNLSARGGRPGALRS